MPLTVRTILQPGQPQETVFERTYANVSSADALAAFKGLSRVLGGPDPDTATPQQLADFALEEAFRWAWNNGRAGEKAYQESLLAETIPNLNGP